MMINNNKKNYHTKSGTVIDAITNGINHNKRNKKMKMKTLIIMKRIKVLLKITDQTPFPTFEKINPWFFLHNLNKNPKNFNPPENHTWHSKSTWKNPIFPTIKIFKNSKRKRSSNFNANDNKGSKTIVNVNLTPHKSTHPIKNHKNINKNNKINPTAMFS